MKKQNILNTLKDMIKAQKNTTRANALNTIRTIATNYLSNATDYQVRTNGDKKINIGDLAERIVYDYLSQYNEMQEHDNINADYDAEMNGEKIEIKSVVNADSGTLQHPNKTYILLMQGKNQGIYLLDSRKANLLVGARLSRDLVEQFATRVESLNNLLTK